jgi:adenylate cyclase, class 2
MSRPEIEIKFRVAGVDELSRKLQNSGFQLETPRTREMNTLYDTRTQTLRRRGELLRLREYGPEWILTHKSKGQAGRHKTRLERETRVADGSQMEAILQALGYQPSFRYEKFRAEWGDGTGHVVVDETPIGDFAEIEGPAEWIDRTAGLLGVDEKEYITLNYAALFAEWKRRTRSKAKEMTFAAVASERL